MLYRFDGLSRDPLTSEDARRLMASHSSFWLALHEGAGFAPFLADGYCVELVPPSARPTGLALVDESGGLRFCNLSTGQPLGLVAWVRQIWTHSRRYRLERFPWRTILRLREPDRAWRAADFAYRGLLHLRWLAHQQRRAATAEENEAAVDRVYSDPFSAAIYDNFARIGLHEDERALAERFLKSGERILDIGCGTGREAFGFARMGLRVVGIDVSAKMIGAARRHCTGLGLEAEVSFDAMPMSRIAFPPTSFDAVFIACDVYARTPGRDHRVALIRRCREALNPGGRVMASTVLPDPEPPRKRLLVDGPRRLLRPFAPRLVPEVGDRWNPGPNPEDTDPIFFKHRFASDEEILDEFREAGFPAPGRFSSFIVAINP